MKKTLKLEKDIYGVKGALEKLDEEFKEFIIKQPNYKEFFELYNRFFYNIDKIIHTYFLNTSIEYAYPNGYVNPRMNDLRDLQEQIQQLKDEIANVERHHFYFKNGKFIMSDEYEDNPGPQLMAGGKIFYIQSHKKRKILDYQTYKNLKMRVRKSMGDIDDTEFITFVDKTCMMGLPLGPPINTLQDIYIPLSEINMYPKNTGDPSTGVIGIGTSNQYA